ncbi:arabinogalactan endo-beta-1,4-galactanase [Celerinatantimonas sp. YJH-8]|uniref:glycoside hydrolase family 53 protein n=1 Tax=Celerinatantimonas sp. YJH-8 TaxID=3228714 RepID=UPI0038C9498B
MQHILKKLTQAVILSTSLSLVAGASIAATPATEVSIKPIPNLPADFIKGADISILPDVEQHGGKFYNRQGVEQDPLLILKNNGINYVRIRLWNDPQDAKGNPYGGGNNDLKTDLALAKRAHALGLKLLLDFHYSDFWTDPGKQFKPKAWKDLDYQQLTARLGQYTQQTVAAFVKAGVSPDMIQIGNEINSGILWPTGKSWGQDGHEFDRLANMLKVAIKGAKASDPNALIMLHLAKGADQNMYKWWFGEITKRDVPFDIIGVSFYPYWDGKIPALLANLKQIAAQYNKDVIVAETQYGYSTTDCDKTPNSFGEKEAKESGYPGTVQGQADFLHDLITAVNQVPQHRGKGIFYWEPLWLPVKGSTWATPAGMDYINDHWQQGNSRENQDLFDCHGKVLPSIQVFN